jgi:tyrosyl-tRNA synthetase
MVRRPAKFGGDRSFSTCEEMESAYAAGEVHPMDLKNTVADGLIEVFAGAREFMSR